MSANTKEFQKKLDMDLFLGIWMGKFYNKISEFRGDSAFFLEFAEILTRYLKEELKKERGDEEYFEMPERSHASSFCADLLKGLTETSFPLNEKNWIIAEFIRLIYPYALASFLRES